MATNNILDLPRDQFLASLNELAAQGVNTDELMRQYRRANSPFSGFFDWAINSERDIANEGRTTAGAGLFSKEAGTTGMDALASTRIEPANFIAGLLSGGAQAVDAAGATLKGLVPAADMPMEALGTAGMAMTGGAAAPKPRGALGANSLRNAAEQQRKMTLWHGSPYDFDQFDLAHIGRGEGAQDLGRGFSLTDSQGEAILYTNPASRWGDLAAMERYRQAGPGRYYRVDINAAPEQFLDWNKPWRDQVPEGTPLYDAFAQNEAVRLSQYADDPAMQEAIPRAKVFQMWRDNAGFEDAALQSGFVGNNQRNYSGDTQYTVFDPSMLRIDQKFDADGNIISANRDATTGAIALPAARNEAERMARQILEMRAAGRAGDVTDAMMAQADPQYMFNNTPLPMDEASRMARAGEMGFDTRVYHGSRDDMTSMDQLKGSAEGGAGTLFSSDEARVANTYATKRLGSEGENVLPLLANVSDYSESGYKTPFPFNGSDIAIEQWLTGLDRFNRTLDNSKTSYFENAIRSARNAGQSGTVIRQVEDDAVSSIQTMPSDVHVTLDPTTIRSRFARFDPEFSHLANLNAANASPLAGILAMPNEEERNRQLGMLFGGYR